MAEKWSDDLPDDAFLSEEDRIYMQALATIKVGLAKGFDFTGASAAITIEDEARRQSVLDDVLKVILAEEHFMKKTPLAEISRKLNLPEERIDKAVAEMLEDIEKSPISPLHISGEGTVH